MNETTHQERIPNPIRYLCKLLDKRQQGKVTYSIEMMWKLVLMGISAGKENIPALSQWVEDNDEALYKQGYRTNQGEKRLPSQISFYRFFWTLEQEIKSLEQTLKKWAVDVSQIFARKGKPLVFNVDGKHLRGTKRERAGDKAMQLVSLYLHNLGVTLMQEKQDGDEAKLAEKMLIHLEAFEGQAWILTGDAAFTEKPMVEEVIEKKGLYLFALKNNNSVLKDVAEFAFSLPESEQDSSYNDCESRSGEIWFRDIDTRLVDDLAREKFPKAQQFVRCIRTIVDKSTGEIKARETDYAITSIHANAQMLYGFWRGHWSIENRSHHKRDTIWREDHCRMRNGAQTFAALRNLVLSIFHINNVSSVLRETRRFSSKPHLIPDFLGFEPS